MSKGARTTIDLEKEIALLRTRDSARAREIRAVRAEMTAIERLLNEQFSPATNSTPLTPLTGATAGTAPRQSVRSFFLRLIGR